MQMWRAHGFASSNRYVFCPFSSIPLHNLYPLPRRGCKAGNSRSLDLIAYYWN